MLIKHVFVGQHLPVLYQTTAGTFSDKILCFRDKNCIKNHVRNVDFAYIFKSTRARIHVVKVRIILNWKKNSPEWFASAALKNPL